MQKPVVVAQTATQTATQTAGTVVKKGAKKNVVARPCGGFYY